MKRILFLALFVILFSVNSKAGDIGIGLKLGDPTGLTAKFKLSKVNSVVVDLGSSYFGNPRINVDYIWDFNAFNSSQVNLYAGLGAVVGLGEGNEFFYKRGKDKFYYRDSGVGIGANAVFGLNFMPKNTPLELFVELGALVGISPDFGSNGEGSIGVRFYP